MTLEKHVFTEVSLGSHEDVVVTVPHFNRVCVSAPEVSPFLHVVGKPKSCCCMRICCISFCTLASVMGGGVV